MFYPCTYKPFKIVKIEKIRNNFLKSKDDLHIPYKKIEIVPFGRILNKILLIYFMEWNTSEYFRVKMKKKLEKAMNKHHSKYLSKIVVNTFKLGEKNPKIFNFEIQESNDENKTLVLDADVVFRGNMLLEIETNIILKTALVN